MFREEVLLFPRGGRSNYRIPSLVVTREGTVCAFCNDRKDSAIDHADEVILAFARKKPGQPWGDVQELRGYPGWACHIGSAVYDGETETVMCSYTRSCVARDEFGHYTREQLAEMAAEADKKAREMGLEQGARMLCSADEGETWQDRPLQVNPVAHEHWDGTVTMIGGSCHGSAHGIQLQHGANKGRLLCPSRIQIGTYTDFIALRKCVYNNAIYSDDHGLTWQAGAPVQLGTGEGTLIERGDGSILYNSRAYFRDQKRYLATSYDGGATWGEFCTDDFLLEEECIGCNASFLRVGKDRLRNADLLPENAEAITLFANPRAKDRSHMTVCYSFDDGATWHGLKEIYAGPSGYSSLDFSDKEQLFYLLYEKGESDYIDQGVAVTAFDLAWLLTE